MNNINKIKGILKIITAVIVLQGITDCSTRSRAGAISRRPEEKPELYRANELGQNLAVLNERTAAAVKKIQENKQLILITMQF